MELRPEFKKSEVGIIPEEWDVMTLKTISPQQSVGLVINPSTYFDRAGTVPMLVGSNVGENIINWAATRKITEESNQKLPASRLSEGDLVMVRVGEPGITAVIPTKYDDSNCASMMIVRKHPSFNSMWLCYLMNSFHGRLQVKGVQYGTAQKQFNISDAVDFQYPVPPLHEQRAIATTLSDVDALLEGLERLIAKKRDLKKATMQQLISGKTRLPGFEGEWEPVIFGNITFPKRSRIDPSRCEQEKFCVELEHIDQGTGRLLGWTETTPESSLKSVFTAGDVLFGKLRAYLKKYWLADRAGVCSTEIWVLSPNRSVVTSEYLYQLVQTDWFIESASTAYGTHMPRSDWKVVKEQELTLPLLREQIAIATVLSDMDAEIDALEQRSAKTRDLKQAMMQELLTGKTRLI